MVVLTGARGEAGPDGGFGRADGGRDYCQGQANGEAAGAAKRRHNVLTGEVFRTVLVFDTAAEEFRTMRRPCDYSQDADWTGQLNRVQGTMAASSYDADGDRVLALWLLRDYDEEAWECVYRVATGFLGDVARTMGFFVAHMSDDSGGGDALLRSSQGHRYGVYNLKTQEGRGGGRRQGARRRRRRW
uniref:Uncharacterized protein n=1 Tax=Oryza glaberrima TaxID=4538 RepID=I1PTJ8_ORYGL